MWRGSGSIADVPCGAAEGERGAALGATPSPPRARRTPAGAPPLQGVHLQPAHRRPNRRIPPSARRTTPSARPRALLGRRGGLART
eukprot:3180485-Rhodomonas_salina.1